MGRGAETARRNLGKPKAGGAAVGKATPAARHLLRIAKVRDVFPSRQLRGTSMPGFPPHACHKGGAASAESHRENARAFYADLLPVVAELKRQGLSLRQIAAELTRRGIRTRQEWEHW